MYLSFLHDFPRSLHSSTTLLRRVGCCRTAPFLNSGENSAGEFSVVNAECVSRKYKLVDTWPLMQIGKVQSEPACTVSRSRAIWSRSLPGREQADVMSVMENGLSQPKQREKVKKSAKMQLFRTLVGHQIPLRFYLVLYFCVDLFVSLSIKISRYSFECF